MAKPRILVVEDGAVAAAVIKSDLEKIGYDVGQAAASGEEAVKRAESERPDLILMDIFLAGAMDGIEAADQIRRRLDIPVVFMTAHADDELLQRAKISAPYGYLVKPFQARELHATVEMALYRAQMEKALVASEEKFRTIAATAQDAIIMIDAESKITYWNEAAQSIFGYTQEEARGQDAHELLTPEPHLTQYRRAFPRFQKTGQGAAVGRILELSAVRKGGEEFPVELSLSAVFLYGKWQAIGIIRDITERKRAEEELKAAKEAAEAANQAKSEFLARMSHELRTPMNAIMGMTELALKTRLDEQQRDYLETVREASGSLLTLVNDILDFSKIEADRLELEETPFALRHLLAAAIEAMESKAQEKGLALEHQIEEGIPDHFQGDPHRLDQVLVNLVGNAIKFTEEGGVRLRVEEEGRQEGTVILHFSVAD
ncbi:MAG: PAS domain S-box protein, partial [Deltaproteobacteria bacterium]|nr:PAS domain S-box protein [Deltaproteobacteria bacterium]